MVRAILVWAALCAVLLVPLAVAATSPLLAYRQAVYVAGGFAGVLAMALILLQPLLAGGYLPGLGLRRGRLAHRWVGVTLVVAVAVHVAGLWITSPPDMIDALTFTSPTPFSAWGVVAMWAVFAAAVLAGWRRRVRPRVFRLWHTGLVVVVVLGSVVHAVLIEGTMGTASKAVLCVLAVAALVKAVVDLRTWAVVARFRV